MDFPPLHLKPIEYRNQLKIKSSLSRCLIVQFFKNIIIFAQNIIYFNIHPNFLTKSDLLINIHEICK